MDMHEFSYDVHAAENRQNVEKGQKWRQFVIGAIANLVVVCVGYCMGWTSPINSRLKDPSLADSPLPEPITIDEEAWIGSILPIGAVLGTIFGGALASGIGRRWSLLACSIPLLIGWQHMLQASSVSSIYAGRLLWGIAVGMVFTVTPMYCAEIATDDSRGALSSYLQVSITVGYLLSYVIGPYISYMNIAYVGIGFVAVFDILFFFIPETPIYYLIKNDRESAAKCLMALRGQSRAGVEVELDLKATDVANSMAKTATFNEVFRGTNFKAFYICSALIFFQQFSGINAVLFYMTNIFEAAGSDLDPSVASIIVGIVMVAASLVTSFVVDRLSNVRRLLRVA